MRTSKDSAWRAAGEPTATTISAPEGVPTVAGQNGAKKDSPAPAAIEPHLVYRPRLTCLVPGEEFHYRVLKAGKPVFDAVGHARKSATQPFRFALFGDCGQGTAAENALAYFLYWDQPLNGPVAPPAAAKATHVLTGSADAQPVFLEGAKPRYPRMANFSFDYGNSHWTVIDANTYMDWSNPALRDWLRKDLAAAQSAAWRIVALHQPGFNSSKQHPSEQQMRPLSPIFEAGNVDIVFAGHVHNYQRSFPMQFAPRRSLPGRRATSRANGPWIKEFGDGATRKPHGVRFARRRAHSA